MLGTDLIMERRELGSDSFNPRLDYARYLLVQTAEPVEKIAADCGWQDETIFTKEFQKQIGVTPAHYRSWHQN